MTVSYLGRGPEGGTLIERYNNLQESNEKHLWVCQDCYTEITTNRKENDKIYVSHCQGENNELYHVCGGTMIYVGELVNDTSQ